MVRRAEGKYFSGSIFDYNLRIRIAIYWCLWGATEETFSSSIRNFITLNPIKFNYRYVPSPFTVLALTYSNSIHLDWMLLNHATD